MTITSYIIRMLVALFLGINFVITIFTYLEAKRYGGNIDLTTYITFGLFILFAYLLWRIK